MTLWRTSSGITLLHYSLLGVFVSLSLSLPFLCNTTTIFLFVNLSSVISPLFFLLAHFRLSRSSWRSFATGQRMRLRVVIYNHLLPFRCSSYCSPHQFARGPPRLGYVHAPLHSSRRSRSVRLRLSTTADVSILPVGFARPDEQDKKLLCAIRAGRFIGFRSLLLLFTAPFHTHSYICRYKFGRSITVAVEEIRVGIVSLSRG